MTKGRRQAILALLALPLARYTAFGVQRVRAEQARMGPTEPAPRRGRALLTLDLDQWAGIKVAFNGRETTVTAQDIWEALQ